MKKTLILFAGICLTLFAVAQKQFVVDPNAEMRILSGSFQNIIVSGGIELYLSQSDKEEIAVSASDEKYIIGIKTVVDNNTLRIYYDADKNWSMRNKHIRAYVSFVNLEKLEASGASDVHVAGMIKVSSLLLKLSGASDFKGEVSLNALTMNLSGASDVNISGTVSVVNIESSGASDVKAYGLTAEICTAKASGASDINITVSKELSAHASGASDISYKGTAVIKEMQSSGASSVGKKNR
jgi:hypothetical protein